jgi:hypothetical protein
MIKAYAADFIGGTREFQLVVAERVMILPLLLECSKAIPGGNPDQRAHRVFHMTSLPYRGDDGSGVGYFFAAAIEAFLSAYFFVKRSTRPAVSISFCLPVKKGWQFEQISVRIELPLMVERVSNWLPQAQCTVTTW